MVNELKILIQATQGSEAKREDSTAPLLSRQQEEEEQEQQQQEEEEEGGRGRHLGKICLPASREAAPTISRGAPPMMPRRGGRRRKTLGGFPGQTR